MIFLGRSLKFFSLPLLPSSPLLPLLPFSPPASWETLAPPSAALNASTARFQRLFGKMKKWQIFLFFKKKGKIKTIANNLFLDWSGDPGETGRRAGSGWKIILKCLKNPPKNCWKIILKYLINPKKIASMSL